MTPERHQLIKRLFLEAVELPPLEADRHLQNACGDDHSLRDEVESLLSHHDQETFLPEQALEATAAGEFEALANYRSSVDANSPAEDASRGVRPPGTIIAGRYRLAAPLGRGGMGTVYRAEDLELNQTVALKFLGPRLSALDGAENVLRREVRIARQITHPNVVRVFDIGACEGETFLSMEYVAGENLDSLVRRIGPLNANKLLQVAWQLAAGLAAAHDVGVVHRDLKPSNVMLDGNGNVRILDFGIAAAIDDRKMLRTLVGTPGFVAPEVLSGVTPSPRSDLYLWGLVVYYAATGNLPTPPQQHRQPALRDELAACGVSPGLAAAIAACFEINPALRPRSAHDLVIKLSAGDPLRAAVEAGSVPTPDLVIASRSWQPSAPLIDGLLAGGLALLLVVNLLADQTLFLSRCGLAKSPDALRESAESTLRQLGWPAGQRPVKTNVLLDTRCLQYVGQRTDLINARGLVQTWRLPAIYFAYRQGDPRLPRPAPLGEPFRDRLEQAMPGTASVHLDGHGRLLYLALANTGPNVVKDSSGEVDWNWLFAAAGLERQDFQEVAGSHWPPLYADEVRAWQGPHPADPSIQLALCAAAVRGKIVYFDVEQPWERAVGRDAVTEVSGPRAQYVKARIAVWLALIGLATAMAWQNVRRGLADWRAAWRVAAAVTTLAMLGWLLGSRHTLVMAEELTVGYLWLSVIVFSGVAAAAAFLAAEPAARRWWPWSIITTSRLLAGRWTDRGIWADVLLGLIVGLGAVALRQFFGILARWMSWPVSGLNDFDLAQDLLAAYGIRYKASIVVNALHFAVVEALLLLSLVVALKRLTKSTWAAAAVLIIALVALADFGRGSLSPTDWMVRALLWTIATWLLIRGGLLATIAALTTFYVVNNTPITLHFDSWYAPTSIFVVATLAVALLVCWRLARPSARTTFMPETAFL